MTRHRSNAELVNGYKNAIKYLSESGDPRTLGKRMRGPLEGSYSCRLTRSYRLLYSVDVHNRIVHLLDMGDHKDLFGRG